MYIAKRLYLLFFIFMATLCIFNVYYEKDTSISSASFFSYLSDFQPIEFSNDNLKSLSNEPIESIDEISLELKDKMGIFSFLSYFVGFFVWLGQYLVKLFDILQAGVSFLLSVFKFAVYVLSYFFI